MLFPAIHQLGFRTGRALYDLFYTATSDKTTIPSLSETVHFLVSVPELYRQWWWNLVMKDPLHVAVETTLLISIVYIILSRNTVGYKNDKERLTKKEQEELLWEWKNELRAPLAPEVPAAMAYSNDNNDRVNKKNNKNSNSKTTMTMMTGGGDLQIVVQRQEGKWLTVTTNNSTVIAEEDTSPPPTTRGNNNRKKNSKDNKYTSTNKVNEGKDGATTSSSSSLSPLSSSTTPQNELRVLNFCNFDFLGLQTSSTLREASTEALNKYGCGSCGPRGFYGTIDTHLQLEDAISAFTKTDGAIMYSDGASTCSSTVAAFAKRGDLLVVDEGVYEPLMTGVYLSRANVHWFRHNDMDDLERVLKELQATDKKLGRNPNAQRRFIVVEGLYKNLGTVAPLDKIVDLKHKYHYRLMLDESFSFGTLGATGRGALEEYGRRPMYDAEIMTIALENALGSVGGVTVGNEEVVDHQRLSGAGYCFSASAPPFTASAAMASLKLMEEQPQLVQRLQSNVKYMYTQLEGKLTQKLVVTSDPRSPIVVLQLERESVFEAAIMSGIMQECLQRGVAIVATGQDASSHLRTELAPCIRMTVSSLHETEDMDKAIQALAESAELITSRYPLDDTLRKDS